MEYSFRFSALYILPSRVRAQYFAGVAGNQLDWDSVVAEGPSRPDHRGRMPLPHYYPEVAQKPMRAA